jgi:peroxiredoxin
MITTTGTHTGFCRTAVEVLVLSCLWFLPPQAPAGELSGVSAILPPGFSLPDLAGRQRSLNEFTGKVLLVTFWASWCRPCLEEMPAIRRLIAEMEDAPFAVIAVNVGEAERRVKATAKRLDIDFPVLLDRDSAVFNGWGAKVLPTAYILDGSGRVRYVGHGPVEWDRVDIVDSLARLTEQSPHGK